jgi:hypothetical protein
VGARRVGASCGCARLDVVDEKEIVQSLDGMQVEMCYDALCVESGFGNGSVRWVDAECEKGGEVGNGRRVWCAYPTHDDRENDDLSTRPVLANGIGEGSIFVANHVCGVGEVVVRAIFPFPSLNLFYWEVLSASFRVADKSGFEEHDEIRFVCRARNTEGVSRQ